MKELPRGAPALEIRLFGEMAVRVEGRPLPAVRSRKVQWLLALLVLRRHSPMDRPLLAGLLWPDSAEEQALGSLRKSLHDLRHALGSQAARLTAPTPRTLQLELCECAVDVSAFDAAVRRADVEGLERAIELYSGPLLEGCSEDWALQERAEREQAYLRALDRLAAHHRDRGEIALAVDLLQRHAACDPFDESVQRALMEAHAGACSFAAATQVYRDLRLRLRQELNADPDPATTALYEQLRAEARRRTAPLPPTETEPKTSRRRPSIPRPLSRLVGRREELREIKSLLSSARLVTLTGAGGVGKTRLATEAALALESAFPDGAAFVELAGLADESLLAQTVATALNIPARSEVPAIETLLDGLRSRAMLLVLDNCEHLIEACARLAKSLAESCPELRILATSRQALGIVGEITLRVPSLPLPDPQRLPESKDASSALLEYESVQLFTNLASACQPTFRLTPQNASAVAQICHRLDGIPLAIELAAARTTVLSAEQIAARLDDAFHLLTAGSRAVLPRHQTLRAAMDWSYDLLADSERTLLSRLSVFAGGWELESAEEVAGEDEGRPTTEEGGSVVRGPSSVVRSEEVLRVLGQLVDKSMALCELAEPDPRYRMLETVRQYAREKLVAAGEEESIRARHAEHFARLAERAKPELFHGDQAYWLARLEREHDNCRAALRWCCDKASEQGGTESQRAAETGLRMASSLGRFWEVRGYLREAVRWLEALLASPGAAAPTKPRADALNALSNMDHARGNHPRARDLQREALAIRRETGDRLGLAGSLNNLGNIEHSMGNNEAAMELFEQALAIVRELDMKWGIGATLNNLGRVATTVGDRAAARRYHEESLGISRQAGDREGITASITNLAPITIALGDFDAARAHLIEGLELCRQFAFARHTAYLLDSAARLCWQTGERERAARLFAASESVRTKIGSRIDPENAAELQATIDDLRPSLGETRFESLWDEGQNMSAAEAIADALAAQRVRDPAG